MESERDRIVVALQLIAHQQPAGEKVVQHDPSRQLNPAADDRLG